ncbi:hypothetical protein I302_102991 [Kwoniella bestiolae CBS 10118]|uniref:Uncharacterized protein n=1 Tax=Kwoniella bestiolae CBS 10118 TaxID=1296100 RepID=A0A1B9GGS1_9TREE|nr:hypothetical protein I302_01687 [Kwoniella bestiolae CBS 10118]OCF30168.1 hypothetical protein I302_01687 [Kwoniella bestiolae CBS 10118]
MTPLGTPVNGDSLLRSISGEDRPRMRMGKQTVRHNTIPLTSNAGVSKTKKRDRSTGRGSKPVMTLEEKIRDAVTQHAAMLLEYGELLTTHNALKGTPEASTDFAIPGGSSQIYNNEGVGIADEARLDAISNSTFQLTGMISLKKLQNDVLEQARRKRLGQGYC